MANGWFHAGFGDGKADRNPSLPTDKKSGYNIENAAVDLILPGIGALMAWGETPATSADDAEYLRGYKLGLLARP